MCVLYNNISEKLVIQEYRNHLEFMGSREICSNINCYWDPKLTSRFPNSLLHHIFSAVLILILQFLRMQKKNPFRSRMHSEYISDQIYNLALQQQTFYQAFLQQYVMTIKFFVDHFCLQESASFYIYIPCFRKLQYIKSKRNYN